jgi:S1-C subfamily serine protease
MTAFFLRLVLALALCGLAPAHAMESMRGILDAVRPTATPTAATPDVAATNNATTAAPVATPTPAPEPPPESPRPSKGQQPPVVRVNVAAQAPNFMQPWRKNPRTIRQGLGVVLMDGRILVTAELVADHIDVELEKPDTALKAAAEVEVVDYDANLALLAAPSADFLQSIPGARLDESVSVGDRVEIMQLEPNGKPVTTPATVTTVEVGPYPVDENAFLVFKLSVPLQSRENSFTIPALKDGRLVGLVMRYSPATQTADLVPAPVIAHFLRAAAKQPYAGFPRAGLTFSDTRDPQLRRFAKIPDGTGGAYITKVLPGSPADAAGVKAGDVLLSVDGRAIDQDGNYEDERFGKISLAHYVSTALQAGQKIPIVVWRDGAEVTLEGTLAPRDRSRMISQPYIFDREPDYVVVGGVVFSELSRQFLREFGRGWQDDAPLKLLYLDRFQSELPPDRGRIVFISSVLNSPNNIGYEGLGFEVVEEINGKPIRSLADVAAAVDSPEGPYHRIRLAEDPGLLVLDVEGSKADEERIKQQYGLESLRRLEWQD